MITRNQALVTVWAAAVRLMALGSILLPFLLAACGEDNGGGGPAY